MPILLDEGEIWELIGESKTTYQEDLLSVAKAQLKAVVEWMKEYRHDCIECGWTITPDHEDWQDLLKEVE